MWLVNTEHVEPFSGIRSFQARNKGDPETEAAVAGVGFAIKHIRILLAVVANDAPVGNRSRNNNTSRNETKLLLQLLRGEKCHPIIAGRV